MHTNQPHPKVLQARHLRKNMTDAEWKIWDMLRGPQCKFKFRRQHPIAPYIVDFYCAELKLIIEADGGQHGGPHDIKRDMFLKDKGYYILRFWNNDILENPYGVWDKIAMMIDSLHFSTCHPQVCPPP